MMKYPRSWLHFLVLVAVVCQLTAAFQLPLPLQALGRQSSNNIVSKQPSSSRTSILLLAGSTSSSIEKIEKTDEEWKQELAPQEFYVLREAGTEAPNTSILNDIKDAGTFICKGCGAPLFTTSTKFESGTGWPSFYQPIDRTAVDLKLDYKLLLPRTEACCATCDGHLGHVFEDGPDPTGQRYCLNGVSLNFRSDKDYPELASTVAERGASSPFKPTVGTQLPTILFNGAIGVFFFASFVTKASNIEVMGGSLQIFDFFPVIPAVFYGVQTIRGIKRIVE